MAIIMFSHCYITADIRIYSFFPSNLKLKHRPKCTCLNVCGCGFCSLFYSNSSKKRESIIECYINENKLSLWGSVSNLSKTPVCDLKTFTTLRCRCVFPRLLTKLMVSHKCFTTQFPPCAYFQSLITYANKNEGIPTLRLTLPYIAPPSSKLMWLHGIRSRSPVYHYVLFSLLPQILFHCKMMAISKASRQWLWSGSFSVPAGKVIWVGSYFQPVMLPGILQGAATVL